MTLFTSEYESKLDSKGRLVLPSRIKSQLPETDGNEIAIRKGFEQCLYIYPMVEFKKVFAKVSALNEFKPENRTFQRNFLPSTSIVELDANARFTIPKSMIQYAQLEKDVMILGMGNRVEIWNPSLYEKHQIKDQGELSQMAEKYISE